MAYVKVENGAVVGQPVTLNQIVGMGLRDEKARELGYYKVEYIPDPRQPYSTLAAKPYAEEIDEVNKRVIYRQSWTLKDKAAICLARQDEVRSLFNISSCQPIDIGGVMYQTGYESAGKLESAVNKAERKLKLGTGPDMVGFIDITNQVHAMPIADGEAVAIEVGDYYENELLRKSHMLTGLDAIAANPMKTQQDAIAFDINTGWNIPVPADTI